MRAAPRLNAMMFHITFTPDILGALLEHLVLRTYGSRSQQQHWRQHAQRNPESAVSKGPEEVLGLELGDQVLEMHQNGQLESHYDDSINKDIFE